MTTLEAIRTALTTTFEPAEPQAAILAYLKTREGKTLTKRDLPKLKAISPDIDIRHIAGMTQITFQHPLPGWVGSMVMGYDSDGPCLIDTAKVEERNAAYFSARVERNLSREAALANATALREASEAIDALRKARATLARLTAYGAPLSVISSTIDALVKAEV